jgi:hypothetical protein
MTCWLYCMDDVDCLLCPVPAHHPATLRYLLCEGCCQPHCIMSAFFELILASCMCSQAMLCVLLCCPSRFKAGLSMGKKKDKTGPPWYIQQPNRNGGTVFLNLMVQGHGGNNNRRYQVVCICNYGQDSVLDLVVVSCCILVERHCSVASSLL